MSKHIMDQQSDRLKGGRAKWFWAIAQRERLRARGPLLGRAQHGKRVGLLAGVWRLQSGRRSGSLNHPAP